MPHTSPVPKRRAHRHVALSLMLSACLLQQGCDTTQGLQRSLLTGAPVNGTASTSDSADSSSWMSKVTSAAGCIGGAVAGAALAKTLSEMDAKRQKLSPQAAAKRERGYMIGLALLGCGGGAVIAGTVYNKLSDAGRKAREQELLTAAASAKQRTYRDPENPSLQGSIRPLAVYADAANKRECRDIEDTLADAGKGEAIVVKYCRGIPGGGWAPATA